MMSTWPIRSLGDVCDVINGGTPKTGMPGYWDGPHLWITPAEMGKRPSPYVGNTARKITDRGLQNSSARMLPPNSVILSSRAPIGHLVINTLPMATNQGCKGLVPCKDILPKFLYYYLGSIVEFLESLGTGATFKELSGGKLKNVSVPVPPRSEQERVVAVLDEAFAGLAAVRTSAEQNLQNARALFEGRVDRLLGQRGTGWVQRRLSEICVLQRGFDLPTQSRVAGKYPLVSSSGVIDTHHKAPVKGPGVATGRSGSIGKVFYIEDDFWPLNTVLYVKNFNGNDRRFVYRLLARFDLKKYATGAGVPTLNRNFVHDEPVWVPESMETQQGISEKIDLLEKETRHLEAIYRQKLTTLDDLKKSLLHQAFTGQLTAA